MALPVVRSDLHEECKNGDLRMVKRWLNKGIPVNSRKEGYTALQQACKSGHDEVVEFLLQNGADVHQKSFGDYTALHFSCQQGNQRVVELLLQSGANIFSTVQGGKTTEQLAMESGHSHLVKYIKQYKKEHPHPPASSASSLYPSISLPSNAANLTFAQSSTNQGSASPRPSGVDSPISLHQNTLYHSCSSLITVDEVGLSTSTTEKQGSEQRQINDSTNAAPSVGTEVPQSPRLGASSSAPEIPSSSTVNVSSEQPKTDELVNFSNMKDQREEMRRSRHRSKSATSLMVSEDSELNSRKSFVRQASQDIPRPGGEGKENESGEQAKGSGRKLNGTDGSAAQKKRCIIS